MELLLVVAVFFVLIWALNKKLFIGKLFVIKLTKSKAIVLKGVPPTKFITECKIMARKKNSPGYIYGVKDHQGIALKFSSNIKEETAQRFRNLFPFEQYHRSSTSTPPDGRTNRKKKNNG
ncbi:MAG TPA: DUF3634 family protein [Psychromonas sp.]